MRRYPLSFLVVQLLLALVLAVFVAILGLNPSGEDLGLLVLYMAVTGSVTTGIVYALHRYFLNRWMNSLRWSLILIVFITVIIVFANVYGTAQLMFINYHDLALTTVLLLFGGGTAIICGMFIAGNLNEKIGAISTSIHNLAHGNLDIRLPLDGQDELSRLAQQMNWLADNLQEVERQKQVVAQTRRDLIAWISHDLRTPLTAIRAQLEAIADGVVEEPAEVVSYVNNSLTEVENLKLLIDDLFEMSRIDAGHIDVSFEPASLSDLISDTVSSLKPKAQSCNINIRGKIAPNIDPVEMASDKIQRVLYNLVENAIRHTPPQGAITIRARASGENVQVDVHNTGSFIGAHDLPYIFKEFYRGDTAREQHTDGQRNAGLGLAIARGFVEAHNGSITVKSSESSGTMFTFTLPRKH